MTVQWWLIGGLCLGLTASLWGGDQVVTTEGAIWYGTLVEETETQVVLETAYGRLHIPRLMVKSLTRDVAIDSDKTTQEKLWATHLALSFLSSSGKTTEGNLRGAIGSSRETPTHRTRLDGSYYYLRTTDTDKENENRLRVAGLQELINPVNRLSVFTNATYDYDSFKSWVHRLALSVGMGYDFYNQERFKLIGRLGGGFKKDFGGTQQVDPETNLGIETEWQVGDIQRWRFTDTLHPSFTRGSYRNNLEANWSIDVGGSGGLFLSLGTEYRFESKPTGGDPHGDVLLFGSLAWEF
jgi:putative salt-induced outer membrane protein YdiY